MGTQTVSTVIAHAEPLRSHGALSVLGLTTSYRTMTRIDAAEVPYRLFEDVLEWRIPTYVLSTGAVGEFNIPVFIGARPRDQATVYDGISVASRSLGMFPSALIMPEFMERTDILLGTDAVILAGGVTSALWVQQPWYNTRTPYTRVWYCQSAYDYIAGDAVFSQNVAPNVNTTLGFRRTGWLGRYTNQWLDGWNTRALVRWNPSSRFNISLIHRFTNWGIGTNGGIDMQQSDEPTNERTAVVKYSQLDQRLFRHDIQVCATDSISRTRVLSGSLAFYHEDWNVYRSPMLVFNNDSRLHVRWSEFAVSGLVRVEERITSTVALIGGIGGIFAGGSPASYASPTTGLQAQQHLFFHWSPQGDRYTLRGGWRLMLDRQRIHPQGGIALDVRWHHFMVSIDGSSAVRVPSWMEPGAYPERIFMFLTLARYRDSTIQAEVVAYLRSRTNPIAVHALMRADTILTTMVSNRASTELERGGSVELRWRISGLIFTTQLLWCFDGNRRLPLLYSSFSAQYEYRIGRNRLRGELFLRARTAVRAEQLVPQTWSYLPANTTLPAAFDGINLAISGELGNAIVKLAMGNILSTYYTTLSTFPQLDRHITLSVAWTFFD